MRGLLCQKLTTHGLNLLSAWGGYVRNWPHMDWICCQHEGVMSGTDHTWTESVVSMRRLCQKLTTHGLNLLWAWGGYVRNWPHMDWICCEHEGVMSETDHTWTESVVSMRRLCQKLTTHGLNLLSAWGGYVRNWPHMDWICCQHEEVVSETDHTWTESVVSMRRLCQKLTTHGLNLLSAWGGYVRNWPHVDWICCQHEEVMSETDHTWTESVVSMRRLCQKLTTHGLNLLSAWGGYVRNWPHMDWICCQHEEVVSETDHTWTESVVSMRRLCQKLTTHGLNLLSAWGGYVRNWPHMDWICCQHEEVMSETDHTWTESVVSMRRLCQKLTTHGLNLLSAWGGYVRNWPHMDWICCQHEEVMSETDHTWTESVVSMRRLCQKLTTHGLNLLSAWGGYVRNWPHMDWICCQHEEVMSETDHTWTESVVSMRRLCQKLTTHGLNLLWAWGGYVRNWPHMDWICCEHEEVMSETDHTWTESVVSMRRLCQKLTTHGLNLLSAWGGYVRNWPHMDWICCQHEGGYVRNWPHMDWICCQHEEVMSETDHTWTESVVSMRRLCQKLTTHGLNLLSAWGGYVRNWPHMDWICCEHEEVMSETDHTWTESVVSMRRLCQKLTTHGLNLLSAWGGYVRNWPHVDWICCQHEEVISETDHTWTESVVSMRRVMSETDHTWTESVVSMRRLCQKLTTRGLNLLWAWGVMSETDHTWTESVVSMRRLCQKLTTHGLNLLSAWGGYVRKLTTRGLNLLSAWGGYVRNWPHVDWICCQHEEVMSETDHTWTESVVSMRGLCQKLTTHGLNLLWAWGGYVRNWPHMDWICCVIFLLNCQTWGGYVRNWPHMDWICCQHEEVATGETRSLWVAVVVVVRWFAFRPSNISPSIPIPGQPVSALTP